MPQEGQYTITVKTETKERIDEILQDFGSYDKKLVELVRIHDQYMQEVNAYV